MRLKSVNGWESRVRGAKGGIDMPRDSELVEKERRFNEWWNSVDMQEKRAMIVSFLRKLRKESEERREKFETREIFFED